MKHFDDSARLMLRELQRNNDTHYVDVIWMLRYPDPPPKSSRGWPFRHVEETPSTESTVLAAFKPPK
jgi:hypothetical protein